MSGSQRRDTSVWAGGAEHQPHAGEAEGEIADPARERVVHAGRRRLRQRRLGQRADRHPAQRFEHDQEQTGDRDVQRRAAQRPRAPRGQRDPRDEQRDPHQHADARHPPQVAAQLPQVEDELAGRAAAQARDQRREPRRDLGGEPRAGVGERAPQHQVHVGHRQQQGVAAPREDGGVRLARGDAHDGREGIGLGDAVGGREQQRAHRDQVGFLLHDRVRHRVRDERRHARVAQAAREAIAERVALEQAAADLTQNRAARQCDDTQHGEGACDPALEPVAHVSNVVAPRAVGATRAAGRRAISRRLTPPSP